MKRIRSRISAIPVPKRVWWLAVVVMAGALIGGCSKRSLSVESYANGAWKSGAWELTRARVERDGSEIIAHFVIEGEGDQRLVIENHLRVNPEVTFVTGTWMRVSGSLIAEQGVVRASSTEFLGGQGGAPSVGGRFLLRANDGTDKFRATIPLTAADVVDPLRK